MLHKHSEHLIAKKMSTSVDVEGFLIKLNNHLNKVVREKYQKVAELRKIKDNFTTQSSTFVDAYVDYTHTIEAVHTIIEHGATHN